MNSAIESWRGVWSGAHIVVLASGPSLTKEDVDRVGEWRDADLYQCRRVIVTNNTFMLAPWADVLFFHDSAWWNKHRQQVVRQFMGLVVTPDSKAIGSPAQQLPRPHFDPLGNSGTGAIALSILAGASRVLLLGADCKYAADGKRHWHGDHKRGIGNCISVGKFAGHYDHAYSKARAAGVEIMNASRDTAIQSIPRVSLDEALK